MSNQAQKLSLQVSLGLLARKGASDAISLLGKGMPASIVAVNGGIATIQFEVLSDYNLPQIDVPIAGSEYARAPLKKGDKGIVLSCDASIAGVSGMSNSTASLSAPANLSALTFFPIGNKNWKAVDPNMYVLTGRSDVMLRDDALQVQLEDMNTAYNTLVTNINNLLLVIGPLLTTPQVLTPLVQAQINPVKPRV